MTTVDMRKDFERRKLNIAESLIIAGLLGMAGMIFWMRDAVVKLTIVAGAQADEVSRLRTQLADVPAVMQRVSRLEVRVDSLEEQAKEQRQMKGLR